MSSSSLKRMWESYTCDLNLKYGDFSNQIQKISLSKFAPKKKPIVIETFTAHNLRHTFATVLYFSGVDILTTKEQLGHSNIKTTLEIYTHLDHQFKERSMSKLNSYIDKEFSSMGG